MRRIGLLVLPEFQVLGFSALAAFEVANKEAGETLYDLRVLSERGGAVRSSLGMEVSSEPLQTVEDGSFDTILIAVGMEVPETPDAVARALCTAMPLTRRLAAICLGSFVLGDAGLLDGRRATTHWLFAERFRARFPRCGLDIDRIFTEDGPIWTSAGMSAASDLAIGMIERDHGAALARKVARGMVLHHRRAGGQSQHSVLLDLDSPNDRVQKVVAHAKRHLRDRLSLDDLAEIACLSRRQFTRLFRTETGVTPARAVELLRLEAAQHMVQQSRLPIEAIAAETGFGNRERMRRTFLRIRGVVPMALRAQTGPVSTIEAERAQ